ncbi:MAG: L-2-amino-thiazoline-4-carboxylic acid hydrolase [Clostridiales bacterium]|nr:L-2-amino-thiazoline-4-carboxylic acid hydrolase [Clostridiales bacterium]
MSFNERHHAYISATFYRFLKEMNYPNYQRAFKSAVQKMAEQRGARMAQRAIRDGLEVLDYNVYRHYGEWDWTCDFLDSNKGEKILEVIDSDLDYGYIVYKCPWADVYQELGLALDGGESYCSDLDPSIVRGFNPALEYRTTQTLQTCETCVQYQVNGNTKNGLDLGPRKTSNMKDFDYHCGHVFKTFSEYMTSIYQYKGVLLNTRVLESFCEKFGQEMTAVLISYLKTDFNSV